MFAWVGTKAARLNVGIAFAGVVSQFERCSIKSTIQASNHHHAVALYPVWYNYCRPHKTLKGATPAMAAGLADEQGDG